MLDKDLVRGLSEKEVEIEHLKDTVIALNQKVAVLGDMEQDVSSHKKMFAESEGKRKQLQIHITETSVTIKTDTVEHTSY